MRKVEEREAAALGGRIAGIYLTGLKRAVGVPAGFWDDPFALGFLVGCALKAVSAANMELEGSARSRVAGMALGALSGHEPRTMAGRLRSLARSSNPEFRRGWEHSERLLAYTWGFYPDDRSDPDIAEARRRVEHLRAAGLFCGETMSEHKVIAVALQLLLFNDVIVERFGIETVGRTVQ